MKICKINYCVPLLLLSLAGCDGQAKKQILAAGKGIGGNFENGAWIYNGQPAQLASSDTSPAWKLPGQKLLVTGVVYKNDAQTPAAGVVVYYYHTNTDGRYIHLPAEKRSMPPNEKGQTHGYIRGWVKTDTAGRYFIYTVRPGAYPGRSDPAHIHLTVKEPNEINEYYIDEILFDDDILLNSSRRQKLENRGGSGIIRLVNSGGLKVGERDIILGLNIPGYPGAENKSILSGKNIGEDVSSFTPRHAWGPDKGTIACPVCKYGNFHGILYFVGNNPDWNQIKDWLTFLEAESKKRQQYLKVYFVYGNSENYSAAAREKELSTIGKELGIEKLALTFVPSFKDGESDINLNAINPEVENTFILFKRRRIIGKFINLVPGNENYDRLITVLDKSINEYFYLQ